MNDQTRWLRLIFLAVVLHTVIYFVLNFQPFRFYDWHYNANTRTFTGVKANTLTGTTEVVVTWLSAPPIQTVNAVKHDTTQYNFDDILDR